MIVIAKRFGYIFPWELRPFPKESTLFLKEGAFLPRELGPFLKENYLLLEEVVFFTRELFLLHGELVWDWHLYFLLGEVTSQGQLTFKTI
jgi:hypothetical protein